MWNRPPDRGGSGGGGRIPPPWPPIWVWLKRGDNTSQKIFPKISLKIQVMGNCQKKFQKNFSKKSEKIRNYIFW